VVFALGEAVLFAWVFGMTRGWEEINKGGEIRVPYFVYYILKYVTPVFLLVILLAYVFQPAAGWKPYLTGWATGEPIPAWKWSGGSMIGKLMHIDVEETKQAKLDGIKTRLAEIGYTAEQRTKAIDELKAKIEDLNKDNKNPATESQEVKARKDDLDRLEKDAAMKPEEIDRARTEKLSEYDRATIFYEHLPFYRNIDRLAMVAMFLFFAILVGVAWSRRPSATSTPV
jgi:hypothetical protein